MPLALERGVPLEERLKVALGGLADWDAARIFLEVVRCGSFRSAAERLDLSINAVRRRIDDFERQIGTTLFTRDVHGARLTDEGTLVVSAVERMEAASFELVRAGDSLANAASGEVRVSVTEGLGTFWLAPRLVEFQQTFPNILVDLHCAMRSADVSRHEADIAIHLALQVSDEAAANDAFASFLPGYQQRDLVVMRTNVSSANYWAVAHGAGIGVFPTYACALGGKIIPLEVDLPWSYDIWLSYHATSGRIPRVRLMIDWLVEAFNPGKYPWFKDEFIHPQQLKTVYMGEPLTHLFGGFSTEGR